jgi:hypothetical protein
MSYPPQIRSISFIFRRGDSRLVLLSSVPNQLFDEVKKTYDGYIGPTANLLDLTGETLQELRRQQIPQQVWDSVKTGEAVSILKKLFVKAWENSRPDDDDEGKK